MTDPKRIKCSRCAASGKIQSTQSGPASLTDCPTCLGEGYVLDLRPQPSPAVELDECDELRRAKETALLAASHMLRIFAGIRAALTDLGDEHIAKSARKMASEGESQAAALITLLREVGAP